MATDTKKLTLNQAVAKMRATMKKNNKRNGAMTQIIGGLTAGLVIMSVLVVWLGCEAIDKGKYQRAYSRAKHTLDIVCDEAEDYEDCKISEYKAGLKAVSEPLEVL